VKYVRLTLEVMSIVGLLVLSGLAFPFFVAWLVWHWSKTRKCGR
jgi:hypothetical protein